MMQLDEQQAIDAVKRHKKVLEKNVAAYNGEVLDYYGDGSLSVFRSANDAANCAIHVQQELRIAPVVPLRIGLHIGEILFEEGNPFGTGVNVASRIQSMGVANSVLLSKEIVDKIRNHPNFKIVSLGVYEFKNVEEPMEVFALTNEGLVVPTKEEMKKEGKLKKETGQYKGSSLKKIILVASVALLILSSLFFIYARFIYKPPFPNKDNSIAVLYFNNMSGDPKEEYFSDGITEEIISRLSMIEGLRVKSRTSVLQYKGKAKSIRQIAKELGVKNILEGSIRKQGNQLRITAQLINAQTDEHIWTFSDNKLFQDIFQVQSDIAHEIASKFQIKISNATSQKLETPATNSTEAYDRYLKALSLSFVEWGLGGSQTNRLKAIELLREAIKLDPKFSNAYSTLSTSYVYYSLDADNPKQWLDSAEILARKAIMLTPERENGYSAMAFVHETRGNLDEALKWMDKVQEISPYSYAGWVSGIYRKKKEYGKAYRWVMNAIEYDPSEPDYYVDKAFIFYDLGMLDSMKSYIDFAMGIKQGSISVENSASNYYLRTGNLEDYKRVNRYKMANDDKEYAYQLAIFYLFKRDFKKADSLYQISSHPDDMDAGLAKLRLGQTAQGKLYLTKAIERRLRFQSFDAVWHNFDICRAYAALGDMRFAEYWKSAVNNGWHDYIFIQQDPFLDAVRKTPEFIQLNNELEQRNEKYKADLMQAMREG
jgi:TolB-like protein/Tfp pilus assembly protein PilF